MELFVWIFIKQIFLPYLNEYPILQKYSNAIFASNLFSMVPHRRAFHFCTLKTFIEQFNLRSNNDAFFVDFAFHHSRWKISQGH